MDWWRNRVPQFAALPNERVLLYSPVALRLVDAFTLGSPIGRVTPILQEEVTTDDWREVDATPFRSVDDIVSYPGFGRAVDVDQSARTHRVSIDSDFYETSTSRTFPVHRYKDDNPLNPGEYAQQVEGVVLQPNARYPYGNDIPLVRGHVKLRDSGQLVERGEIRHQSLVVFTNEDG
jgi:hypothetical protein